jgi:arsenite methyltransferase
MAVPAVAASYFYSTGPGKLSVWKELLDGLDLRGDEHVLDVGCGRGAVLISAAHRLPQGRATGADIRRLRDQTGNSRAAAERNAMVEGVSDRVEFAETDARDLPFPPGSFDVALSNLAFSNIRGAPPRLADAVRPSRPSLHACLGPKASRAPQLAGRCTARFDSRHPLHTQGPGQGQSPGAGP